MNINPSTNEAAAPASNGAAPSEINKLIADIEEVLTKAGHIVDQDVTQLRTSLRQKLAMARSGLAEGSLRVSEAARTAVSASDGYVHRSPWQAIGIAAVAGATLGLLMGRRRG